MTEMLGSPLSLNRGLLPMPFLSPFWATLRRAVLPSPPLPSLPIPVPPCPWQGPQVLPLLCQQCSYCVLGLQITASRGLPGFRPARCLGGPWNCHSPAPAPGLSPPTWAAAPSWLGGTAPPGSLVFCYLCPLGEGLLQASALILQGSPTHLCPMMVLPALGASNCPVLLSGWEPGLSLQVPPPHPNPIPSDLTS